MGQSRLFGTWSHKCEKYFPFLNIHLCGLLAYITITSLAERAGTAIQGMPAIPNWCIDGLDKQVTCDGISKQGNLMDYISISCDQIFKNGNFGGSHKQVM